MHDASPRGIEPLETADPGEMSVADAPNQTRRGADLAPPHGHRRWHQLATAAYSMGDERAKRRAELSADGSESHSNRGCASRRPRRSEFGGGRGILDWKRDRSGTRGGRAEFRAAGGDRGGAEAGRRPRFD